MAGQSSRMRCAVHVVGLGGREKKKKRKGGKERRKEKESKLRAPSLPQSFQAPVCASIELQALGAMAHAIPCSEEGRIDDRQWSRRLASSTHPSIHDRRGRMRHGGGAKKDSQREEGEKRGGKRGRRKDGLSGN